MQEARFTGTFPSPAEGLKAAARLNNGSAMPWVGLGVFQIPSDAETESIVRSAIELGYRSIDTASIYRNERGVGQAIRSCGVPRGELFVTTKVWNDAMRQDCVETAFEDSLRRLGLDYVDLYLLHWPIPGKIVSSWRSLESLHRAGRIRAIGVSNFMLPHFEELLPRARIVPAINQIEYHPYLQSRPLVEFCRSNGIQMESWSPLMQGGAILQDPTIVSIARAHGKSVAQVILRWNLQGGVVTIPKTARTKRLSDNASIFDFELSESEMNSIIALDRNERRGMDPLSIKA